MTLARALRLAVAIGLTAYVIWKADPLAVVAAARGAQPGWLAGAVLLVLFDRSLMAWRWIELLAPLESASRPSFPTVLRIFFVSTFVGSFLPGMAGDAYRAYSLSRHRVRISASAASVLMDRLLGVLSMVLLGTAALALAPDVPRDRWTRGWLVAAALGCAAAGTMVFSARVERALEAAIRRLPWSRVRRMTSSLTGAIRQYANHRWALLRVLIGSVAVQCLRVLQAYCLARAIGIALPLGTFFIYVPIAVLLMQLPVTISGLGTAQVAFVWLFGQSGVPPGEAAALSLLFIALGVLGNLPGALLYARDRPR